MNMLNGGQARAAPTNYHEFSIILPRIHNNNINKQLAQTIHSFFGNFIDKQEKNLAKIFWI